MSDKTIASDGTRVREDVLIEYSWVPDIFGCFFKYTRRVFEELSSGDDSLSVVKTRKRDLKSLYGFPKSMKENTL